VATTLGTMIKQVQPFESLEQEVFLMLAHLASELGAQHADLFRRAGITSTQYNALRILRGAQGRTLSCGEIGDRMITRESDVTRLLDRLEKQGLAERGRDERDRRVVTTRITDSGLALLAELDEPVACLHRQQLQHLGSDKLHHLLALLEEASSPPA
jgi:DNA-binding MarR family transcriptional regulator